MATLTEQETGGRPGVPWPEVAQSAFEAYKANIGGVAHTGRPIPAWFDLPEETRVAWEAAVRQAGAVLGGGAVGMGVEGRWAGWRQTKTVRDPLEAPPPAPRHPAQPEPGTPAAAGQHLQQPPASPNVPKPPKGGSSPHSQEPAGGAGGPSGKKGR